ncbi:hypothetical protein EDD16DRAFT_1048682 [Pisolithus croceorrhizus]|nr:hypothetical protein EDD16DRAFT_1048682 [Pisolithus croceorrhizus]KAI6125150.1 hypothetical protein EV401DRAFT_1128739 [Pisolithus croceorrhizus]KAI6137527.1 hypothetical protein EDD17DRAFT_446166 [Pisolithus thermaeus]
MTPVLQQPTASLMPVQFSGSPYPSDEKCGGKHTSQCQIDYYNYVDESQQAHCQCSQARSHRACHKARLRKMLGPILLVLLVLGAVILVWCMTDTDLFETVLGGDGDPLSLFKRQSTSSSGSSFTKNKLYLIVIFVGLLLVVAAAIMLSFWCCKGSFENPLCCPCYLCACCGGLACLECIGCGLCAAGLDEAM